MSAQILDWAPVGAKYFYEVEVGNDISYQVFTVEKDTVVSNISVKKIIMDSSSPHYQYLSKECLPYVEYDSPNMSLTFERNDTLFFYQWKCNRFVPVAYNLSDTTQTWFIPYDCNSLPLNGKVIIIDTIYFGKVNSSHKCNFLMVQI
ncbi:MAG: hypothetical protein Fur0023_12520 [Bacteroidia bacterium]